MKRQHRNCPLCGHAELRPMAQLTVAEFDGASPSHSIALACCENCGMAFNDVPLDSAALEQFYQEEALYAAEMGVGSGGSSPFDRQRYQSYLELIAPYFSKPDSRVVDVGCAKGGFLAFLKEEGCARLRGVELNPNCAAWVTERYGIEVATGSAQKLPLPAGSADLLVYSHVLEHIADFSTVLAEAGRALKPEGILFAELPDGSRYHECAVSPYYWLGLHEHINHFDAEHLALLLNRAGFELLESRELHLPSSPRTSYPSLQAVFRKCPTAKGCGSERGDLKRLQGSLERHAAQQLQEMQRRQQLIDGAAGTSGQPVYLWGIGLEFFCLYGMTTLKQCRIVSLIDKNPHKQRRTVDGLKIVGPEALQEAPAQSTVFLTSALHQEEMGNYLRETGFRGQVIVLA